MFPCRNCSTLDHFFFLFSQNRNCSTLHKNSIFFKLTVPEISKRIFYIYLKAGNSKILLYLPITKILKK